LAETCQTVDFSYSYQPHFTTSSRKSVLVHLPSQSGVPMLLLSISHLSRMGLTKAFLAGLLVATVNTGSAAYLFTDLGTLGGRNSNATAINNSGQIVGSSDVLIGYLTDRHAVRWDAGVISDLGVLGTGRTSEATDINNAGIVVGYSLTDSMNEVSHAMRWDGTVATDIGTAANGISRANAINDAGLITGAAAGDRSSWKQQTMLWDNNVGTNLGTLRGGEISEGRGINSSGTIVGASTSITGQFANRAATSWNGTTETALGCSSTDSNSSIANDINDTGIVVGYERFLDPIPNTNPTRFGNQYRAKFWDGSSCTILGSLGGIGSMANAVNANNQIVGYATTASRSMHATMWDGGSVIDLNELVSIQGWVLQTAWDINDNGWIVGDAYSYATGDTHAFLLSIGVPYEAVPEPGTIALLLTALTLLWVSRRNWRV